ncbi:MAG: hypothetical protein ACE366_27825 [Bradymonadia bacterium]
MPIVRILAAAALLFSSTACGNLSEVFGLDEVPRVTVETEIPVTVRLPPQDLPGLPESVSHGLAVSLPVDVIAHLEETGREDDAKLLKKHRKKLEGVELVSVEYEVRAPNQTPADVDPIDLYFGPPTMADVAEGMRLGRTVGIPAETAIALREIEYDLGAPGSASAQLSELAFSVGVDTALTLEAFQPVPKNALALKLLLKVQVHVNVLK